MWKKSTVFESWKYGIYQIETCNFLSTWFAYKLQRQLFAFHQYQAVIQSRLLNYIDDNVPIDSGEIGILNERKHENIRGVVQTSINTVLSSILTLQQRRKSKIIKIHLFLLVFFLFTTINQKSRDKILF